MFGILDTLEEWIRDLLISMITSNLTNLFDDVNTKVGTIATEVGQTPQGWNSGIFNMVKSLSDNVIVPIAGLIITFVLCYELITAITEKNNMHDVDTFIFFKYVFKAFVAVYLLSHTFDITMAVFDVAQHVISFSGGVITADTAVDASALETLEDTVMAMDLGPLLGLYIQTFLVGVTMWILSKLIFVIVMGRMLEIYLVTSLAPIPFSTFGNREQSQVGQNYLRSLIALGFQGFLIMVVVGIYAVMIQTISITDDIIMSIWTVFGYTILLCFTLFKTGSLSKSVLAAH